MSNGFNYFSKAFLRESMRIWFVLLFGFCCKKTFFLPARHSYLSESLQSKYLMKNKTRFVETLDRLEFFVTNNVYSLGYHILVLGNNNV